MVTSLLLGEDDSIEFVVDMMKKANRMQLDTVSTQKIVASHYVRINDRAKFRKFSKKIINSTGFNSGATIIYKTLITSGYWVGKPICRFMSNKILRTPKEYRPLNILKNSQFLAKLLTDQILDEKMRIIQYNKYFIYGITSYYGLLLNGIRWLHEDEFQPSYTDLINYLDIYKNDSTLILLVMSKTMAKMVNSKKFKELELLLNFMKQLSFPPLPEFYDPTYTAMFECCPDLLKKILPNHHKNDLVGISRTKIMTRSLKERLSERYCVDLFKNSTFDQTDKTYEWRILVFNRNSLDVYKRVNDDPDFCQGKKTTIVLDICKTLIQLKLITDFNFIFEHCKMAAEHGLWHVLRFILKFMECEKIGLCHDYGVLIFDMVIPLDGMEDIFCVTFNLCQIQDNCILILVLRGLLSCIYSGKPLIFSLLLQIVDDLSEFCCINWVYTFLIAMLMTGDLNTGEDALYHELIQKFFINETRNIKELTIYQRLMLKNRNRSELINLKQVEEYSMKSIFQYFSAYDVAKMKSMSGVPMSYIVDELCKIFLCCCKHCTLFTISGLASRLAIIGQEVRLGEFFESVQNRSLITNVDKKKKLLGFIHTKAVQSAIDGLEIRVLLRLTEWTRKYELESKFLVDEMGDMIIANPGIEKDLLQYSKDMGIKISVNKKALKFLLNSSSLSLTDLMSLAPFDYKLDSVSVTTAISGI